MSFCSGPATGGRAGPFQGTVPSLTSIPALAIGRPPGFSVTLPDSENVCGGGGREVVWAAARIPTRIPGIRRIIRQSRDVRRCRVSVRRSLVGLVLLFVFQWLLPGRAAAQNIGGSIHGTITDSSHATVPGV